MNWLLHDVFKTETLAKKYGETIVETGLAKGIKIVLKKKGTKKSFELYILPITKGE